jgi:hypothetical protein
VHQDEHIASPEHRLHQIIRDVLVEGINADLVRDDVPPDELANYCLGALTVAGGLRDPVGVQRLVAMTLAGLRPTGRGA